MKPLTYRRKLQKKKKHKPHRQCPKCLNRMVGLIMRTKTDDFYLQYQCIWGGCGWNCEVPWTGGGTGRHIPGDDPAKA